MGHIVIYIVRDRQKERQNRVDEFKKVIRNLGRQNGNFVAKLVHEIAKFFSVPQTQRQVSALARKVD